MTWLRMVLVPIGISLLGIPASAAPPRDPSGVWLTEGSRARIKVEKCGPARENLCGYVVWLPPKQVANVDKRNPNPRLAGRPVLGHQMIMGLKPNEDGEYEGSIYNAEDGKTYDVTIWLENARELKVKGCLVAFLCSTQTWSRVTDVQPGQLAGATGTADGPRPDPEWASKTTSSTSPAAASTRRSSGSRAP